MQKGTPHENINTKKNFKKTFEKKIFRKITILRPFNLGTREINGTRKLRG